MTCDTCVHWDHKEALDHGFKGPKSRLGACMSPKLDGGYSRELPAVDGAVVENDEGWGLVTGPKFGCIQWRQTVLVAP
jgi:hypothetical protein